MVCYHEPPIENIVPYIIYLNNEIISIYYIMRPFFYNQWKQKRSETENKRKIIYEAT